MVPDSNLPSSLEFRSAADGDAGTCDPPRTIGRQDRNHAGDVRRLADSLEGLKAEGEVPAGLGPHPKSCSFFRFQNA